MERNSGEKKFIRNNRLGIVASALAAISIATAAAVEKPNTFKQLASSAESASHLGLKGAPKKAYEQVIDKLPEAETAEAAPAPKDCIWVTASSLYHCVAAIDHTQEVRVVATDHIAIMTPTLTTQHTCHANVTNVSGNIIDAKVVADAENVNCNTFGDILPVCVSIAASNVGWPQALISSEITQNSACSINTLLGGADTDPKLKQLAENLDTKEDDNTLPVTAGVAAGIIGASGTALYIKRRLSK